jgi:hypothetical protein
MTIVGVEKTIGEAWITTIDARNTTVEAPNTTVDARNTTVDAPNTAVAPPSTIVAAPNTTAETQTLADEESSYPRESAFIRGQSSLFGRVIADPGGYLMAGVGRLNSDAAELAVPFGVQR